MKYSLVLTSAICLLLISGCGNDTKLTQKKGIQPKPPDIVEPAPTPVKKSTNPPEPKTVPSVPPKAADEDVTVVFGKDEPKRSIVIPKSWKQEEPSSNMRLLQFKMPKVEPDTEDGDMGVFRMSGGGGADANIGRWTTQFGGGDSLKLKRTLKTASGHEATVAELEGTYTAMTATGTGEPKTGYKMLGAIIVTDKGEYYFKFAGPYNTVDANKAAFDRMIESFK